MSPVYGTSRGGGSGGGFRHPQILVPCVQSRETQSLGYLAGTRQNLPGTPSPSDATSFHVLKGEGPAGRLQSVLRPGAAQRPAPALGLPPAAPDAADGQFGDDDLRLREAADVRGLPDARDHPRVLQDVPLPAGHCDGALLRRAGAPQITGAGPDV